jgi:hypothetical protein
MIPCLNKEKEMILSIQAIPSGMACFVIGGFLLGAIF